MRALWLVLLLASPAFAQGFGGADEDFAGADEQVPESCVVEVNGALVPCTDILEEVPEEPVTTRRRRRRRQPSAVVAPAPEVAPDRAEASRLGPLERALRKQREGKVDSPLTLLRLAVADLAKEAEDAEDPSVGRALEDAEKVLGEVESHAELGMLRCARKKDASWAKRFEEGTKVVRMTPAGPVRTKPRGGAMLDLPGCERARFVEDGLITKVRRIYAIERELKERRWRYGERPIEQALIDERDALRASLLPPKRGLKRWSRDPEDVDKLYITRPAPEPGETQSGIRVTP